MTRALPFKELALVAALAACLHGPAFAAGSPMTGDLMRLIGSIPSERVNSESRQKTLHALELLSQDKLQEASREMNAAVQLDTSNSYLQFFNAFVYHVMGQRGDTQKLNLAEQGYALAVKFDRSNWIAHYYLALMYFEQRNFRSAQSELAEVMLFREDDQEVLFRMVAASYYSGDPVTAAACLDRLRVLNPADPQILRLSAIISAAIGKPDDAAQWLAQYQMSKPSAAELARVQERVSHWAVVHRSATPPLARSALFTGSGETIAAPTKNDPAMLRVQQPAAGGSAYPAGVPATGSAYPAADPNAYVQQSAGAYGQQAGAYGQPAAGAYGQQAGAYGQQAGAYGQQAGAYGQQGGAYGQAGAFGQPGGQSPNSQKMVLVDVVIMRTEDSLSSHKGMNLLSALTLQFGNGTAPGFSKTFNSTLASTADSVATTTTALTRAINLPALTYSLNIVNSNTNLNEVLARPTLAALEGVKSEFFSGTTLNAAVVSNNSNGGGSVQIEKEIGVKLAILPTFLPDNKIRLSVDAQRTFLKPPSQDVGFTYKVEVSKIMVNANVVMEFGETLVLGGLSEKETTNTRDGVPFLQDIPGVQYLFSKRDVSDFQRSVLMLITPRAPQYTYRSDESIRAELGDKNDSESQKELRARYGDWFKPYPNLASVFNHMNLSSIYREFRTGDVTLEKWDKQDTTSERLKHAFEFLFY